MDFDKARARLIASLDREISDKRVLAAMRRIPRESFVLPEEKLSAYDNIPLPIGHNQTISQPLIIAMMTEALKLQGKEKVLEVGTGCGYQAAILAELAFRVITVERLPELAERAGNTLKKLGYDNVEVHMAGESLGYPEKAPYDAIMVTAAAPEIPQELTDQLRPGGRMVIPVGSRYMQELYRVTRGQKRGTVENLGSCRFVPLIGRNAWDSE
ncbi:MAG: protein-L-isoaspartate(D-aspartate) O-methyltransferase [Dehalococcoidales bacterium]